MADREKVIDGLEHCSKGPIGCQTNCPYQRDFGCRAQLTSDALELIDTQYKLIRELQNLISAGTKMLKGR